MLRNILKSKLHNATITEANIEYEGSIEIDRDLMDAADIVAHEKVLIANLDNGSRIESYAIEAPRGSGRICLNGGAARHGKIGERVIIMTFCGLNQEEMETHAPSVVKVDADNRIREKVPAV